MRRRTLLTAAAATAAIPTLARPSLAQGGTRVLRFVPEGNLNNPDPVWTTTTVARNHGLMIWDMLYALDASFMPRPQMVAGHTVSDDRLTWRFTLRDGLLFHDNTQVRPIDCVTSISRWGKRRPLGQKLLELTADMTPIDDKSFELRLTKPYPLMTYTLSDWCFIMPERIAKTDPFKQITEFVGSGPFRFERDQWVAGSQAIYTRFDKYQPRDEPPSFAAGGKVARVDRVEWRIIPDASTAVAALQNGEVDWIQQPEFDLLPLLWKSDGVKVAINDTLGVVGMLGINRLHPPFDNPKLRRALLSAIDQREFMEAAVGGETSLYRVPCGVFTPGTPMASDAGLSALTGPRDLEHSKQLVIESGYKGEPIVLLSPSDYPVQQAFAQVAADLMKKLGMNVAYTSTDWGTLVQRRASKAPPDKGGWSIFPTTYEGLTVSNPGSNFPMRGNGDGAWFGWPTDLAMEALRDRWFEAPNEVAQKKIAADMQVLAFEDVPFIPLGQLFYATAYRTDTRDLVAASCPIFWSVHKA